MLKEQIIYGLKHLEKMHHLNTEAVVRMCSIKKVFLEISQNLQEFTCARDYFLIKFQTFRPATLLKKSL